MHDDNMISGLAAVKFRVQLKRYVKYLPFLVLLRKLELIDRTSNLASILSRIERKVDR